MQSRLASDLSSMVNNPQLSDVQLQVDSGEVYFAHSFMLYTRCPLLAQMVHDGGFGVQEEGMPAAQRVLIGDVPAEAVHALLQYLYTAHCSVSASLLPDVLELASRFDLEELRQHCQLCRDEAATQGEGADCLNQEQPAEDQTDHAFMDLLRSMWNEEDEDDDGADSDGGRDGEAGLEKDSGGDDLTSGDREICEERVNEEEMDEIYEFAATQRKREQGKETTEEEEEEIDEKEEGDPETEDDQVFAKPNITEPKMISTGSEEKSRQPDLEPDHSLDRSYSRLFSDSWGVYEEEDASSRPSCPSKTQTHQPQQHHSSPGRSSRTDKSDRTCLQSSASEIIDLSVSPPPDTSNLPLPGLSPGEVSDQRGRGDEGADDADVAKELSKECVHSSQQQSQGPRSFCAALPPALPQNRKEPELIVLSDSSEEMEVDLAAGGSCSPSPRSPGSLQNLQNYTQIKPRPMPEPNEPNLDNKESSRFEFSPSVTSAAPVAGRPGSVQSPVDCSPEVSWLIPATPVHTSRNTSSSSTQTHISMRRTQLFPKTGTSSSSSSSPVFSSPALSSKDKLHTSKTTPTVAADAGQTEASGSRMILDRSSPCSPRLSLKRRPKINSVNTVKEVCDSSPVFAAPQSQQKCPKPMSSTDSHSFQSQQDASLQPTSLHVQSKPYSSTPLHTDLPKPPVLHAASPVHGDPDSSTGGRRELSDRDLGSLRLSLSNSSDSPASSSCRALSGSQRGCAVGNAGPKLTGRVEDVARGIKNDKGKGTVEGKEEDRGTAEEEQKETTSPKGEAGDASECSFRQSFLAMEEPPMAFNDSWGLDAGGDGGGNPGVRFSLRLEDSGGSSPGQGGAAGSSSSATSQPPGTSPVFDSFDSFRFHSPGQNITSTPPKPHTTPPAFSPTSRTYGHTGSSVTPPAPGPITQTTPNINSSILDPKMWDSWEEEEEEEALPLSQRVNPQAQLKTPASPRRKRCGPLVPITPMPSYSDMDTPELKTKLNRFGVRPLPKRQMVLKLKEIHQYTHQLLSSDSEGEPPSEGRSTQVKAKPKNTAAAPSARPAPCDQAVKFKQPRAPTAVSPVKLNSEEDAEPLSASQGSNTSSAAASEDSERSNPELCLSSDSDTDSDGGVTASQAASRLQDRLQAVRSFILSDSELYSRILQYQPLVVSQLQERLKAAGIRLGASKLLDYLDSQCITFTTAKPSHSAPSRRRGRRAKAAGENHGRGRKRGVVAAARDY